jgi:ATP-binding cassette subfamily B protein
MLDRLKVLVRRDRDRDLTLLYRVLVEHAAVYWKGYAATLALMGITAACTAAVAYLIANVIEAVYVQHDVVVLVSLCVALVALSSTRGLAAYGQAVLLAWVGNRITADNQRRMFGKVVQEEVGYFADRHSSHFMASLLYGTSSVTIVLNVLFLVLGRDLMSLIGLCTVMVVQDPIMSLIGVLTLPPAVLGVRHLVKRVKTLANTQFIRGANILQVLQETVQGLKVVKAFNLEGAMRQRISEDIESVEKAANKIARVSNRSGPLMETLGGCGMALVILYGGYLVIEYGAPPGSLVSFVAAFAMAYEPAKRIARVNIDLSSGLVGVRVLFDLLDSPPAEGDDGNKPALEVAEGGIEFAHVDFAYRTGEPVLKDICFLADPRSVTALVGPSGGGKSTILSLLLGFYHPQDGEIAIDGQSIAQVSRRLLRSQIAYVGQEPFLFRGTIRDNIICGMPGASDEQIVAAAKAAFAHEFIMRFPLGYDTPVGEFGSQLSMGERQRVAVARAMIKDAPIVLLDEPTASLDSESERKVQQALRELCAGKTTLVIAHRLNTIIDADCIHVVEDGRVVESGLHEALLLQGGRYARFFHLQFPHNAEAYGAPSRHAVSLHAQPSELVSRA